MATTAPEQLSTGPVLQWTEIDPGFDDLFMLESVGDGRVTARAWTDGDASGLFGGRVVVSANGTDWTEVPMPEGLFPDQANISSGRWIVTAGTPMSTRTTSGSIKCSSATIRAPPGPRLSLSCRRTVRLCT